MTDSLAATLERIGTHVLAGEPHLIHTWSAGARGKRTLVFPVQCENGFEVRVEAGVDELEVAVAEGWHDMTCDQNPVRETAEALVVNALGFVRTLLSVDAALETRYAGQSPYKWTLRYRDEEGWQHGTTGLLVFNYLGRRHITIRQNIILPARYETLVGDRVAGAAQQ
jgi:hypothetical protein